MNEILYLFNKQIMQIWHEVVKSENVCDLFRGKYMIKMNGWDVLTHVHY